MSRYFFHIWDGEFFVKDDEGLEFANVEAARVEGWNSASDLLAAANRSGGEVKSKSIELVDHAGRSLGVMRTKQLLH